MSALSAQSLLATRSRLVTPSADESVGPCSVDLHLGDALLRLPYGTVLDPERDQSEAWQDVPMREDGRWLVGTQTLYLAATLERVTVPTSLLALLHGVSSLGRLGLLIHVTAGVVDAGWTDRPLTLEIVSLAAPVYLRPGMRIGQLTYHRLDAPTERAYAGRYAGDAGPTPSRSYLDWRPE